VGVDVDKLVEIFKTLFRECDRCEEIVDCGYLLWFGKEAITLDPGFVVDDELENIISTKCKKLLPEPEKKY
jgi:hypothetical protein